VGLWNDLMGYDSTELLLYSLAAVSTLGFALALLFKTPKKHWFREWTEAGFTAVWLALGIRVLLVEAYSIPSESMVPTLLISDHLVVSKLAFGWHIPKTHGRVLVFSHPKRGQIVIFVPPNEPKMSFVKRCVGLPGDTIEVRDKVVYVNGLDAEVPFSFARLASVPPQASPALQEAIGAFNRDQGSRPVDTWLGPYALSTGTYNIEVKSGQVRGVYARLLDQPNAGKLQDFAKGQPFPPATWTDANHMGNPDWFGPYTLKDGEYWMMGDNRDNSADSRYFGPVRWEALRGTPLFRYWPPSRMGLVH
jgi:signal peptidase I